MGYSTAAEYEPEMDGSVRFHRFRYHLGSGFVTPEDRVLDLGCGTGYGTDIIAQKAKFVTGVDKEQSNINCSIQKHSRDNVEFICCNLEEWDIPECDVACSFEVIEHLYKPKEFIEKLAIKVKKFIVVSVPIGETLIDIDGDPQAEKDSTHHSVFPTSFHLDYLFTQCDWKLLTGIQSGVTYIATYYRV